MSKNNDGKLRRELEILKAQLKASKTNDRKISASSQSNLSSSEASYEPSKKQDIPRGSLTLNYSEIRKDLIKTGIFSVIITFLLIVLKITEEKWAHLFSFL